MSNAGKGIAVNVRRDFDQKNEVHNTSIYVPNNDKIYIEENPGVGNFVYLKFISLAIRQTVFNTLTWDVIKQALPDIVFETSYSGENDCLRLEGVQSFVYDFKDNDLKIINRDDIDTKRHILLVTNVAGVAVQGLLVDQRDNQYVRSRQFDLDPLRRHEIEDLERTSEKIQSVQNPRTASFAFMTDSHYESNRGKTEESIRHYHAINTMSNYCGLDLIVHGGDFGDGYSPLQKTKDDARRGMKTLIDSVRCPVLIAKGNHDDNSYYSINYGTNSLEEMLNEIDWYNLTVKHFENEIVLDDNFPEGGYFYKDLDKQKIRFVVLNPIDIPYIDDGSGNPKYHGLDDFAFRDKQLNFVANQALDFTDKSSPSQWAVIFICHTPLHPELSNSGTLNTINDDVMNNIISAFKNGTSYTSTTTSGDFGQSVSVDYTSQGAMDVIAVISGHTHVDRLQVLDGINHLTCLNSLAGQISYSTITRAIGTNTEDSWTVFTVDKDTRTVYGHRYGAGNDFQFSY